MKLEIINLNAKTLPEVFGITAEELYEFVKITTVDLIEIINPLNVTFFETFEKAKKESISFKEVFSNKQIKKINNVLSTDTEKVAFLAFLLNTFQDNAEIILAVLFKVGLTEADLVEVAKDVDTNAVFVRNIISILNDNDSIILISVLFLLFYYKEAEEFLEKEDENV